MRIILAILLCALGVLDAGAALPTILQAYKYPVDTVKPWSFAGIAGGIPDYAYGNSVADFGADNTGVNAADNAFATAIANCADGHYVWVPPGTYRLNNELRIMYPHQIEVRGGNAKTTILKSYTSSASFAAVSFNSSINLGTFVNITSAADRGQVSLEVNSAAGFTVGKLACIKQSYDAGIAPRGNQTGGINAPEFAVLNQFVLVTNITGPTISFTPPLFWNYRASLTPQIGYCAANTTVRCGLRGVTVQCVGSIGGMAGGVCLYNSYQSWLKDCVVTNAPQSSVILGYWSVFDQIEGNLITHHTSYSGSGPYSLQMERRSGNNLAQNNIIQTANLTICVQYGTSGNVIAYNFNDRNYVSYNDTDATDQGIGICPHGLLSQMDLFEGNVVPNIKADAYWGPNITNTYFRNWCTLKSYINDANLLSRGTSYAAWEVQEVQQGQSFIGNVISRFSHPTGLIYRFDADSTPTLFMHGNFDFVSGATQWSNGVSHSLPISYYLPDAKPSWWGNLPNWPAIGPDVNTTATLVDYPVIPAQYRAQFGTNPPSVDFTITGPADQTVAAGSSATFTVSATGGANYSFQWYRAGAPVGANSSAYATGATTSGHNGQGIYCIVTDATGDAASRLAILTVTGGGGGPPPVTNAPVLKGGKLKGGRYHTR